MAHNTSWNAYASDWNTFPPWQSSRQLEHAQDLQVTVCEDVYQLFHWSKVSEGVNLLEKYYQCHCEGDFSTSFRLSCRLENYCVPADELGEEGRCVNQQLDYDFKVNEMTQFVYPLPEQQIDCIDYLSGTGGPVGGKLCVKTSPRCTTELRDAHGYSTQSAHDLCNNANEDCPSFLQKLGYSSNVTALWCSSTSFNGNVCNTSPTGNCGDATPISFSQLRADCTNIAPCMTPYCDTISRAAKDLPASRIPFYENCNETLGDAFAASPIPSFTPSMQPTILPSVVVVESSSTAFMSAPFQAIQFVVVLLLIILTTY